MPGMRLGTRVAGRVLLALATAWALCDRGVAASGAAAVDTQTRRVTVGAAQTWTIRADLATVTLTGDEAARDVRIDITRHAPTTSDLARLPVTLEDMPEGPTLTLRQGDDAMDPAVRAEVRVTVPRRNPRGVISLVEGGLDIRDVHGSLEAELQRGPITAADVSGALRLATTIGDVTVTRARVEAGGLLRLRAFNGDVRLGFAALPADARVMALVLNGAIQSRLPLTMKDGWGPRWGETTLGAGTNVVSIDVVTGTIRIDAPAAR